MHEIAEIPTFFFTEIESRGHLGGWSKWGSAPGLAADFNGGYGRSMDII